jgi:hypothetical protein
MKKIDIDAIKQSFVGSGKVIALRVENNNDGTYRFHYRDGDKPGYIDADNRKELDELLIEFNGKNPETVSAPDMFLTLDDWGSEDLLRQGHVIQKIQLKGTLESKNELIKIDIPQTCGKRPMLNAGRELKNCSVTANIKHKDREAIDFTIAFEDPMQFDTLLKYISNHKRLSRYHFIVRQLITLSNATKKYCKWVRVSAGDGSRRMVMELRALDGIHYNDCMVFDLLGAADGLIGGECKKIPDPKTMSKDRLVCELYARNQ